jgi:GNAT superfamily N-acetyltransferase
MAAADPAADQTAPVDVRPADDADLDAVLRLRLAFIAEVRGVDPADHGPDLATATLAYLERVTAEDRLRSWLAVHEGVAVGVVSLLITDAPPLPEDHRSREGYVVNLFVAPAHRGGGVARRLLDEVLAAAPGLGLRSLHLYATAQGRPLYEQAGFAAPDRYLTRPVPLP